MDLRLQTALYLLISLVALQARAQDQITRFVHPGGLHTQADLDRMKAKVAAREHPWIDSWNELLKDRKAQLDYKPAPRANMGASRQRASADAVAAYLNAIRGHISGDVAYTDHAIEICNAWSAAVNQTPHGADQPGLNGIYTYQFAVVGEILRIHVGTRWAPEDFARFKKMMREYLYPTCHDFLVHHNGACISHFWANWDASCITAIAAIGVLCDDRALFDEAIAYFKDGPGNGCIDKAVYFIHPGNLGQWQETGRDQEHNQLGVGLLAAFCTITGNQGEDLFGYDHNRLLAATEYTATYALGQDVPYKPYNNCDNVNQYWPSRQGRGLLQRPIWELLYNEYVVRRGLNAPNLTQIAALNQPESYTHDDHFGYGSLLYSLQPSAFPPFAAPDAPEELTASAGVGRVYLKWTTPMNANGFVISRATNAGGPYKQIAKYRGLNPEYYDNDVTNGTKYFYVVTALNQAGTGGNSMEVSASPMTAESALPAGWTYHDIGVASAAGEARYAPAADGTFIITASGANLGDEVDGIGFACRQVTGDIQFTVRLIATKLQKPGKRSRIGIMIRSTLDPDSPAAALVLGGLGYREAHFGIRPERAKRMSFVPGNGYSAMMPTWFRLTRRGDTFTAYQSDNGDDWFKVGAAEIPMGAAAHAGIAVATDTDAPGSMTVDHVQVIP